ncbi:MAG: phosphoribosyltransferase [Sulfolobales archaeon]
MKLVSWDEIVEWSRELSKIVKASGFKPDVIVAVARGGYVPARLLCDFLNVENLLSIQSQHWTEAAKVAEKALIKFKYTVDLSGMKVLLVDDIVDTGESLILAKNFIVNEWRPDDVKIAALQWISPVAKLKPDFYLIEVKEWYWFQYPWTRLEDTYQFIRRMLLEESSSKKEWTLEEIIMKFKEFYGIDVGLDYFKDAVNLLVENGFLGISDGKYVVKS